MDRRTVPISIFAAATAVAAFASTIAAGVPAGSEEVRSRSGSIRLALPDRTIHWPSGASRTVGLATTADGAAASERFSAEADSIRWEVEVRGDGAPRSAPIVTEIRWPDSSGARLWTAWGDSRPVPTAPDWSDPLVPVPFVDGTWHYGGITFTRSDTFGLPIVTVVDEAAGIGLSIVQSPEDILRDLRLETSAKGILRFIRTNHRISADRPVRFRMDLVAHGADWRPGVAWMARRYARFFDPPNPRAGMLAGCGAYSIEEGEVDAWKLHRMAFRVNWKASYDFPHMGMFLPPVGDGETWINFRKAPTLIGQLAAYSERMRALGFHVLNYFNITEYGAWYRLPPPPRKAERDEDLWKDGNDFLFYVLRDAILPGADGKPIGSWEGCVAMDPGEKVYQDFLVDQARRHVEKLPASSGICIDRMDWAAFYNRSRDDGLTWFEGKPARSCLGSWREALARIGPVFHSAGKVIFANPHIKRLELMEEVDGIYEEFTQMPFNANLVGLLALQKPALGWVGAASDLQPDPDAFLQRFLYMGVFPTAPYPANDHTINPDPEAETYYLDYGPLLDALRGRRWVLEERCVEVEGGTARANLFEVPGGYIVPVILGGKAPAARIRIRLPGGEGPGRFRIDALRPGLEGPAPVPASAAEGRIVLDVPLERGCALARLARVWTEPAPGPFLGSIEVKLAAADPGAEILYQVLEGDGFSGEWPGEWSAAAGPIRLDRSATIRAGSRDEIDRGRALLATFHRLPLPPPSIEPAGGIFEERLPVTIAVPAAARGAAIRFTLDGSEPTEASAPYAGPLEIQESAILRARAFREGCAPGAVALARFGRLPPPPPEPDVFLDELKPAVAISGWGGAPRVGTSIQDKPLSVAGKPRAKGIGAHARSELAYDLEPRFRRFVAVVGIDDEMKGFPRMASVEFRVAIDGKVLAASPVLRVGQRWHLDVPIPPGSKRIWLLAEDGGDGINADHADWVEAGFTLR